MTEYVTNEQFSKLVSYVKGQFEKLNKGQQFRHQEVMKNFSIILRKDVQEKEIHLASIVKERKHVTVKFVDKQYDMARTNSLKLMRRVAEMPGFQFIVGSQKTKRPSVLRFNKNEERRQRKKMIAGYLNSHNHRMTVSQIEMTLSCSYQEAIEAARNFVEQVDNMEFKENTLYRIE